MPNVNFFPSKDSDLVLWGQNFSTRITATPAPFGLTAPQCTAFAGYLSAFSTALAACAPDVRSKSAVTAKNAARDVLKFNAKLLANIINGQATVTDAQKQQLGLNVRQQPRPIPTPDTAPVIEVVSVSAWTVKIKLKSTGSGRGKPAGVSGANVFSYVGPTPPASPTDFKYEGMTGRTEIEVAFATDLPAGTKVWLTAFWFNGRKQSGPACSPVSSNLLGSGTISMAA